MAPKVMHLRVFWLASILAACAAAQEASDPPWLEKAEDAAADGRDQAAFRFLRDGLKEPPEHAAALALMAEVAENIGEYGAADDAGQRWLSHRPRDRAAIMNRAGQLWRRGEHASALAALAPLLEPVPAPGDDQLGFDYPATALAARIEADRGRDDEAAKLFDLLIEDSARTVVRATPDLLALCHAYVFVGGRNGTREAEKLLIQLQKAPDATVEVDMLLGELYLRLKHLPADAVEEYKAALKRRPNWTEALLGLRSANEEWMREGPAMAALAEALATNPRHPAALGWAAAHDLEDYRAEAARKKLALAAESHPKHKLVLALQAAQAYLAGDRAAFERGVAAVLAIDPTYGEVYQVLAGILNERRRWHESLELMARAVKVDPENPALHDDHARYSLYLGRNDAAREAAGRADATDVYSHPWRTNIFELLSVIGRLYDTFETAHFTVRFDRKDAPTLARIVLPFMERSYDILTKKYGFVPEGVEGAGKRMLVEVFRDHQEFSVRTVGVTGLGATGVCFGPFIAMDAPTAIEQIGPFSWGRTFHHELAHTLTLGLSKGRIPRWLTEGLSTFEEIEYDPTWTRAMDRDLFDAFHTGTLLPVLEFDAAFRTPRIIYAYYQAGLESEYLVRRFGMDRVIAALRLFGEDLPPAEVIQKAFGVPAADIDEGFRKVVAERVAPMKMQPRYRGEALAALEGSWKKSPSDDETLVRLAWAWFQNGRLADAESLLLEAEKRGLADTRLLLLRGRMAQSLGRTDQANDLLGKVRAAGLRDYDLDYELARRAEKLGQLAEAMALYRDAIADFPTNPGEDVRGRSGKPEVRSPRLDLARLLRAEGTAGEAVALLEEHLRYRAEDLKVRQELIDHYLSKDEDETALRHLEAYVLVDPLAAEPHRRRAVLYLKQGAHEAALAAAQSAAEREPKAEIQADARVIAARALIALGRPAEARKQLVLALEASPANAEARALMEQLPAGSGENR